MVGKAAAVSFLISSSYLIVPSSWAGGEEISEVTSPPKRVKSVNGAASSRADLSEAPSSPDKASSPLDERARAHGVLFEKHLKDLATFLRTLPPPSIFISYSWDSRDHKDRVRGLATHLLNAGIPEDHVFLDNWKSLPGGDTTVSGASDKIMSADKVLLIGSPGLKEKYDNQQGIITQEIEVLRLRIVKKGVIGVIPAWFEGNHGDVFPIGVQTLAAQPLGADYFENFFNLLHALYQKHVSASTNPILECRDKFNAMRGVLSSDMIVAYGRRVVALLETKGGDLQREACAILKDSLEEPVKKK